MKPLVLTRRMSRLAISAMQVIICTGCFWTFTIDAQAAEIKREWVTSLLSWQRLDTRHVVKWLGDIEIQIYFDESSVPGPTNVSRQAVETLVMHLDEKFEEATGRSLNIAISPLALSTLPEDFIPGITIFFTTRSEYLAIASALRTKDGDRADTFIMMLEASVSPSVTAVDWNRDCFFVLSLGPLDYLDRAYAMVGVGNSTGQSLQCLSLSLLATVGLGQAEDPAAPTITSPRAPVIRPTYFDYEILTLLYRDDVLVGRLDVEANQEALNRAIDRYMLEVANEAP